MPRKNLISSTKGIVILLSIVGGINILVSMTTLAPVFSTVSTSLAPNPASGLPTSAGGGSGVNGILQPLQEFVAPSGYDQAREDPSYAIVIPFSDLGTSPFEPASISIPANMSVIWFNEDDSQHSVTFNDTSPEAIDSGLLAQGDIFIHKFSIPGTYDYYDSQNPTSKGRINVGSEFESGQNMDMLVGGNALPFEAGKIGRTTLSFVPMSNVTTIPPTLSITYNVTIANSTGVIYSNQFDDSDGILDLELIPSNRAMNQTADFITWGPDLTDQEGVASDGVYHVQGPVLTENEDYTIKVSIVAIDNAEQPQPPSDVFLLSSTNSTAISSTNSTAS